MARVTRGSSTNEREELLANALCYNPQYEAFLKEQPISVLLCWVHPSVRAEYNEFKYKN